jgi:hypothetical protein
MTSIKWKCLLALLVCTSFLQSAWSQSTNAGDLSGIVTDNTGASIPGATVTVLNIDTGVSKDYVTESYDHPAAFASDGGFGREDSVGTASARSGTRMFADRG